MKKTLISTIIFFGALALAQQGFSAADDVITDGGTLGSNATLDNVSLSPGVTIQYDGDDNNADGDLGSSFVMSAKNQQGPMAYAVEAGDTAVYQQDVGTDAVVADWVVVEDDSTVNGTLANDGSWNKMGGN